MIGYLTQAWANQPEAPAFRLVDTRGSGSVFWSPFFLLHALGVILVEKLLGRVSVVYVQVSVRASTFRKLIAVFEAELLNIPVVLHLHGGGYDNFYFALPRPLQSLVRAAFRRAAAVIALGSHWERFLTETIGLAPEKIAVFYNAVPMPAAAARPKPADPSCRILLLGTVGVRKGVPELIEALGDARLRDLAWSAVIAGDGDVTPYRLRAEALGQAHRVAFPGWIDQAAAAKLLADADILVLPSRAEGLPMSVLEAMANGLAIVTTRVGALEDAITDGVDGLFVPVGDATALAAALATLIESPALRRKLGTAARSRFARDFEIGRYAERMSHFLKQIARESPDT